MEHPVKLEDHIARLEEHIEARLDALEKKLEAKIDSLVGSRRKSMEWIGTLSEHIRSLDSFREEVRATFEPLLGKLDNLDEVTRILRHATSDVSRRIAQLEGEERIAS